MINKQLFQLILFPFNRVSEINSIDLKYPFYFGLNNYIIKTRKMQPRKCGFETLLTLHVITIIMYTARVGKILTVHKST